MKIILNNASDAREIYREKTTNLRIYIRNLEKTENKFINKKINETFDKHISSIKDFDNFLGAHFFPHSDDPKIESYRFYPGGFYSYSEEKYEEISQYSRKLSQLCNKAKKDYDEYRLTIKQVLKV